MDVGLFSLMGTRAAGTPTAAIYDRTVEQVKAAERAGFAIAWFAEHHFSNYCVCPSPLMMVARLAGETSRIRLASGVVIVPLYDPARLIAEVGMVAALTHGRLVLGIGSGYQPYEFERFGQALPESTPRLLEVMGMMAPITACRAPISRPARPAACRRSGWPGTTPTCTATPPSATAW